MYAWNRNVYMTRRKNPLNVFALPLETDVLAHMLTNQSRTTKTYVVSNACECGIFLAVPFNVLLELHRKSLAHSL